MYGLCIKGKKELLTFSASSNNGDFCVDVQYSLTEPSYGESVWLVESKTLAEYVAENDARWYNASYTTPCNSFVGQLEVVEVTLSIQ